MAYKDSEELKSDERYALGEYSFRVERSAGTSPNYDKIEAICTKGGKNARKSIQVPSSAQLLGWYVEANETEASVYAEINSGTGTISPSNFKGPGIYCTYGNRTAYVSSSANVFVGYFYNAQFPDRVEPFCIGASAADVDGGYGTRVTPYIYNGETFYFRDGYGLAAPVSCVGPGFGVLDYNSGGYMPVVLSSIGASIDRESETTLVGRFAIDIEDAGGVGPGSDWIDPGDYDPDWEPEDPTHTLYVEVTGALSGRHNDPIVDPSYSYIPANKNTVKDYGCGGDGGHGGGGGAGASTVVVYKFATNQANSKEVTAIARRHGYGSGGGKGGKGGDGCILVYY